MRFIEKEKSKTAKCPVCGNKYLVQTGYCVSCKKKVAKPKSEDVVEEKEKKDPKTAKIIKDLIDTNWSKDDDSAGRAINMMKGLVFSDDPEAKKFIKDLDKATSSLSKKESVSIDLEEAFTKSDRFVTLGTALRYCEYIIVNNRFYKDPQDFVDEFEVNSHDLVFEISNDLSFNTKENAFQARFLISEGIEAEFHFPPETKSNRIRPL